MDGGDGQDHASSSSGLLNGGLRERQSEIKAKLQGTISSGEELWRLLLGPLDLLGADKNDVPEPLRQYMQWPDITEEDRSRARRNVTWISDVQKLLLSKVLIDWQQVLRQEGRLSLVLQLWFAPPDSVSASIIHLATASTIAEVLSTRSRHNAMPQSGSTVGGGSNLSPDAMDLVWTVVDLYLDRLRITSVVEGLEKLQIAPKRSLIWSDFLRQLLSMPDRAANVAQGQKPEKVSRDSLCRLIGSQLPDLIQLQHAPAYASALFTRLLRGGYCDSSAITSQGMGGIWPPLLTQLCRQSGPSPQDWKKVFSGMNVESRVKLQESFLAFLDGHCLHKSGAAQLLNGDELVRPGTEGSKFLSSPSWKRVLCIVSVVGVLLDALSSVDDNPGSDEDTDNDDDDDDDDMIDSSITAQALLPSERGYRSPLMARLLVHTISLRARSVAVSSQCLQRVIAAWSSPTRIRTASWQQEVYLTTAALLLLAQVGSSKAVNLNTSSTFITGVSTHLEHLSPSVRRMGMLVAEAASEKGDSAIKPLAFHKKLWDGKGDGREEARVLRALYLGWSARLMDLEACEESERLEAFALLPEMKSAEESKEVRLPKGRPPPVTRRLRQTKAPPRKTGKLLIQPVDGDHTAEDETVGPATIEKLPSLHSIYSDRATTTFIEEKDESSSDNGEGSSDSDDAADAKPDPSSTQEPEFGLGMPHKKKRRPPVYIHELAPLLRENDREANKLALRHAEAMIRRKAGWGGEVNENAVDLALAVLAVQNNFQMKQFEERRKAILVALVVASPSLVAPCLAEQYFNQQYSITQRVSLLNSMAFGARELSGVSKAEGSGQVRSLTEDLAHLAINRARVEGEKRVPEMQNDSVFRIATSVVQSGKAVAPDSASTLSPSRNGAPTTNVYLRVASSCFIFPLVTRLWSQLESASRARKGRQHGQGIITSPFMIASFLDTLAVLCHCAQNAIRFQQEVIPEVIGIALAISHSALARGSTAGDHQHEDGGGPAAIVGAAANLLLLLLDAVWQLDRGRYMLRSHAQEIQQVEVWAAALFESVQDKGGLDRSARSSAAILLRLHEMRTSGARCKVMRGRRQ